MSKKQTNGKGDKSRVSISPQKWAERWELIFEKPNEETKENKVTDRRDDN
tara:strand:+ start:1304 stop:1453 length:150 start_codon:yes stop_codon:yes gene_type:complete